MRHLHARTQQVVFQPKNEVLEVAGCQFAVVYLLEVKLLYRTGKGLQLVTNPLEPFAQVADVGLMLLDLARDGEQLSREPDEMLQHQRARGAIRSRMTRV